MNDVAFQEFFTVAAARNWLFLGMNLALGKMDVLRGHFASTTTSPALCLSMFRLSIFFADVKDIIPTQIPLEFSTESMPGEHFMQIIPTEF
jgi:hypothetical protein